MMKAAAISLFAAVLLAFPATASSAWHGHGGFHGGFDHGFHHHFRSRVFIGVGPWWGPDYFWWGPGWGFAYPYPYPYPYSYWGFYPPYYPAPFALDQPETYMEQQPALSTHSQKKYWYYCGSAHDYYPKVKTCPEAWIKVPPTPESQSYEER